MACVSGFTLGGYYEFIDCCGFNQTGLSGALQPVCVDSDYSASTIGLYLDETLTCTQNCNQGILSYNFQVTGICSTPTGSVVINGFGGTVPYTIDPVLPNGSGLSTQTGNGPFTYTGLTGGTYVFRLNDSLNLQNNELYLNVNISNCFSANIYDVIGTTCGLNNGSLSVVATTTSGPYNLILYKDNTFNKLETTNTLPYTFNNLGSGIYYVEIYDYGFSTAKTENVVISASTGLDFGFWKVNTSNCVISGGKLAITGLTGNGPFTYLWNNNQTTQQITGLTQGTYSCTVTDSLGCSTTKSETISAAAPLTSVFESPVNPSCFASDGEYTFTLSGGTRPLYYSASTGQVGYTFSDSFTLTNLSSGSYPVIVRDANFCSIQLNAFLTPQNGFTVVSTSVTNSNCNTNNGSIFVSLQGQGNYYQYSLSGQNTGTVFTTTTQDQNYTFNNLSHDNYLIVISGSGTDCFYTNTFTVDSPQKFNISATTTGATCGISNGSVKIDVGSGYTGVLDYDIIGTDWSVINSPLSSNTFNNLSAGIYTIQVTDESGCATSMSFTITTTSKFVTSLNTITCTTGNNGGAQVNILSGQPPFTYQWSNNVPNNQSGGTVTGLTTGNYNVKITDGNGCVNLQTFQILCNGVLVTGYEIVEVCEDYFTTTVGKKRGFEEMLNEGFFDLTQGYTNCVLNSADFYCQITLGANIYSQVFYTSTALNDFPQDSLWQSTIESILSTIPEIGSYDINLLNNTLQLKSNCNGSEDLLADAEFKLELEIIYDIECEDVPQPVPCVDCGMSGYTFEINQP